MNRQAIIFDMDGVICHTNPYHSIAFKTFFAKRGLTPTEADFADHMYGKSNKYILSYFLKREISGLELVDLEFEKESLFREIYASKVEPILNFLEFLKQLKADHFLTGVATSAPRANLDLIMNKLGFGEQMESIMASEDVINHKPHPEVYLQSAANLKVLPQHSIVFEDSFSGITAGLNAGMKVVGVLSSHTKEELPACSYYINNYTDINVDVLKTILI